MTNWGQSVHGNPQNPLHPELEKLACLQCHEIHTLPTHAKLLRADENTLCLSCHDGNADSEDEIPSSLNLELVFEKTFTHPIRINPNVNDTKGDYTSSLVGYLGTGSVRGCYIQGGSVSGDVSVGGLVAYNKKGILDDCSSTIHVAGRRDVGGLVGYNGGDIIDCHTIGTIAGEDNVGGLAGFNDGTIQESSSIGDVIGEKKIGGLVGDSRFGTIHNSYSSSLVSGIQSVGGLVGRSRGDIMNCYAGGSIAGEQYVGGLVGFLGGPIIDCYSTGHLIHEPNEGFGSNLRIGGLVGFGHSPEDILTSFWDMEASGQTISFGGIGKTTAEMQTVGIFLEAGWDFIGETDNGTDDIWWMTEGRDYPHLWWELTSEN